MNGIQTEKRSPKLAKNIEFLRRTAQKWLEIEKEVNNRKICKTWQNSVFFPNRPQCTHKNTISATKTYDWLNGFEIEGKFCVGCGKTMELTIKAFGKPKTPKKPRRLAI